MVDIHCHVVPGVDDGAADLEMSMAMLEHAKLAGVTGILTTPHIRGRRSDLMVHEEHKIAMSRIPDGHGIDLRLGCEVRVTSEMGPIVSHRAFSADEAGKYVLLELPHDSVPPYFREVLFDYRLQGITPIVAHPERNAAILKNPALALDFVKQGAHLQVTNASVLGEIGEAFQDCAAVLIENGLVSFTASDAHNTSTRTFLGWPMVRVRLMDFQRESEERGDTRLVEAEALCHTNPLAVLHSKSIPSIQIDELDEPQLRKRLSSYARLPAMKRKRFFFF